MGSKTTRAAMGSRPSRPPFPPGPWHRLSQHWPAPFRDHWPTRLRDHWPARFRQQWPARFRQHRRAVISAHPAILTEAAPRQQTVPATAAPEECANPLPLAWQSQNTNTNPNASGSGSGQRECFSCSCAMLARHWGRVPDVEAYNLIRARHGDTTRARAQLAALRSLGLRASFTTGGCRRDLEEEIAAGRPVAVGWLHHGPLHAPRGGGHWSVVIGFNGRHVIHHDPNGEADLLHGGSTANSNGAGRHYSWDHWLPRWEVEGPGSGWMLSCYG